ncbi:MAG TPA: glycosyltransferase [Bacillus bacterium]|nr:glycosyltransferase [Bacillus sp. (in: firmicutes)]
MRRNVLLCFLDGIEKDGPLTECIIQFEKEKYEIHKFKDITINNIQPHHILSMIENIWGKETENMHFNVLSNNKVFLLLTYRLFHQFFERFIYLKGNETNYIENLEQFYIHLYESDYNEAENLTKNIDVVGCHKDIFPVEFFNTKCEPIGSFQDVLNRHHKPNDNKQRVYQFNGTYYLFNPVEGYSVVVDLDKSNKEPLSFENIVFLCENLNLEDTIQYLLEMDNGKSIFFEDSRFVRHFESLKSQILDLPIKSQQFYQKALEILLNHFKPHTKIFILSYLLHVFPNSSYLNKLYYITRTTKAFTKFEKYFLYWQNVRANFVNSNIGNADTGYLSRKLYREIYYGFLSEMNVEGKFIPRNERDNELVIIITAQFLGLNHAPTKTALDRAYSLIKHLNKNVLIINTKELMTKSGATPFYNTIIGNVVQELEKVNSISYKDVNIPYYQPNGMMPNSNEINNILQTIENRKPLCIVNIGGSSIVSDVCSKIVPVISIATVYSGLPTSEGQFHVIGRKLNEHDIEFLEKFGFSEKNVIESTFTFDFKPQEHTFTRAQLNLPEKRFLITVIGARLDSEITTEFIEMLLKTTKEGAHIVFIGGFKKYDSYISLYPELKNTSTNLGFQEDVLALVELCDLYVNPQRAGGGSSAAEAMYKGLPVVTIHSGDVSVAAGSEFCVKNYLEMERKIHQYIRDQAYYQEMAKKARSRAEVLLSTDIEIENIFKKAESNPLFG